jgi:rod shape determining protein RodA
MKHCNMKHIFKSGIMNKWNFALLVVTPLAMFVVLWALRIASRARDRFGALVAVGVAAMLFWHVAINMGMVLGLLPVVGVTLPLFSYGGSSVLANLIGIGLLLGISARRQGSPWEGLGGRG